MRVALAAALLLTAAPAHAQLAVSANDNKVILVNGVVRGVPPPTLHGVSVLGARLSRRRVAAGAGAPGRVGGPPLGVAGPREGGRARGPPARRVDPADPTKQAPDSRMTVID